MQVRRGLVCRNSSVRPTRAEDENRMCLELAAQSRNVASQPRSYLLIGARSSTEASSTRPLIGPRPSLLNSQLRFSKVCKLHEKVGQSYQVRNCCILCFLIIIFCVCSETVRDFPRRPCTGASNCGRRRFGCKRRTTVGTMACKRST